MNRCAKRSGSIVILALLSSCGDGDVRECGEGTALQGGLCVAEPPGDVRCGEGTVVDGESGFCVPLVGCGEGTVVDPATGNCSSETECGPGTFLDLVTKSCVTETACGTGTVADEATRTCKPSVRCGAGTTLDEETDRCLPDPPCVPDAILDPVTGLCESDLECGEGYVLIGGVCFDEDASIAAEADASESVPDRNDPLQGGTAEPLTLEPIGSRAVFTGGIGRPADLSSTGAAQQDRDVWRFVGSAGQYLRIEVRSMGLPQPAFILEGPDGYERTSSVGYDSDAAREVVLPYDGVYELIILPSAFLITGIPMGDPTTAYVGIVEELPLPTPVDLTAGAAPDAPANIQGQLLNLDDNFYRIRVPGRTALQATIIGDVAETVPSILVFDASMRLLADVANLKKDDWAGFFVDTMDDCILVVDWQVSTAPADDFSIDVHAVPLLDRGSLAADFNAVTENQDLAGLRTGAYRFAIAEAQVIVADVFGLSAPDVQVVGPAGTRTRIKDDDEFFFYAEPGEYVMFIHNDLTSDSVDVGTVLGLITPYDLGSLTEGQSSSVAGQPIVSGFSGYADAWVVVTSSVPALVTLEVEARGGDPDLAVYRIDGTLVRGIPRPHMYRPARIVNRDPRPVLLRLMPDGKNVVDWTIHAEVGPLPAHIDGEPNDVQSRAIALGIAPTIVRSTVTTEDTDLYTFSLAEPLAEGRAIRVVFDDLESESATTSITRGSYLRVYDAAMQPLSSIPTPESDGGVLGVNTAIYIASYEGAGPFYIEVFGDFVSNAHEYLLDVDVVDDAVEIEPNDAIETADALTVPSSIVGYRSSTDSPDFFRISLATDLEPARSLVVEARNVENNNGLEVAILDENGTVLLQRTAVLNDLRVGGLRAGTYFIRVRRGTGGDPPYRLSVSIGGAVELEPNDTGAVATSVALTSEVVVHGFTMATDTDIFALVPEPALQAGESIEVTAFNMANSTAFTVELFDSVEPGARLLARDKAAAPHVLSASPGPAGYGLKVLGAGAIPLPYQLLIRRAGAAEAEPNDDDQTATRVPALPVTLHGSIGASEVDVFAIELASALGSQRLRMVMKNISDSTSLTFSFRAPDFTTEILAGTSYQVSAQPSGLPAGTYFVVITPTDSTAVVSDVYSLELEVLP